MSDAPEKRAATFEHLFSAQELADGLHDGVISYLIECVLMEARNRQGGTTNLSIYRETQ